MAKKKTTSRSTSNVKSRAQKLIESARVASKSKKSWYDLLTDADREYVYEVASVMRDEPNAHPNTTARLLKEELGLSTAICNISNKLKDLVRNG